MSTPWLEHHQEILKAFGSRLVAELAKSGFPYPVGFICDPRCPVGREVMIATSLARGLSEEEAAKGVELLIAQATLTGGARPAQAAPCDMSTPRRYWRHAASSAQNGKHLITT